VKSERQASHVLSVVAPRITLGMNRTSAA
jgi:hypothetical protein